MSGEEGVTGGEGTRYRGAVVDGHVHLHPGQDEVRVLRAARANLAAAAAVLGTVDPWCAMVVLTEIAGVDRFAGLHARATGGASVTELSVTATAEDASVEVGARDGSWTLTVVAGRQIQTSEGLEVLAFPMRPGVPDGRPIRATLTAVTENGALAAVPWGAGKWTLRRGALLETLIEERARGELSFFLADTGHRPSRAPRPRLLRTEPADEPPVLTGSDPLPLWGEEVRAGRCAFEVAGAFDADRPAEGLVRALRAARGPLRRAERRVGVIEFGAKQVAMQLHKRLRR